MDRILWILGHKSEPQRSIQIIGTASVMELIALMSLQAKSDWRVKRQDWIGFKDLVAAENDIFKTFRETKTSTSGHLMASRLPPPTVEILRHDPSENRRHHRRVPLRLPVVVVYGSRTFRTHTKDLSLGGALLELAVPAPLRNVPCRVVLENHDEQKHVEFAAVFTGTEDDTSRVRFQGRTDIVNVKWLGAWLDKVA